MPELTSIHLMSIQFIVLSVSLSFLMAQLLVPQKNAMHILFAIFCGSVAMGTTQKITGDAVGVYQYLIGMGACATCNAYWLLSRAMFRESAPFNLQHIALAVFIALLIMVKQGYLFLDSQWQFAASFDHIFAGVLREITIMLSSCILLLMIWEACRGFKQANQIQKAQRITFMLMLSCAIGLSKIIGVVQQGNPEIIQTVIASITIMVMIISQVLISWIGKTRQKAQQEATLSRDTESALKDSCSAEADSMFTDHALAEELHELLINQQHFLQTNLKVADIARALDVSEYRVSRVLKHHFQSRNFNQYVNELRIQHAQKLLADPENQKWPVLVVGMESGFASVGPFTRAFKQFTGVTPNQFRQEALAVAYNLPIPQTND